ncbi:MAG: adenylate kinase family protein [Bacilli bacterium]|jgi:adenylate kinase|nr:nucleoside monophosphate kinase [Bacilli bacterium]
MKTILLIGPPASGKGTQARLISNKYNIPHISTSVLISNVVNDEIKEIMKQGTLVNDDFVYQLVTNRLSQPDCERGYVLEGYPRTMTQAHDFEKLLAKLNQKLNYVFFLDIKKEEVIKRMSGRIVCLQCEAIYNENYPAQKPKNKGICDRCGSQLQKRSDDNKTTFEKRYDVYMGMTAPIINYYQEKKQLHVIKCQDLVADTFQEIEKIIDWAC